MPLYHCYTRYINKSFNAHNNHLYIQYIGCNIGYDNLQSKHIVTTDCKLTTPNE